MTDISLSPGHLPGWAESVRQKYLAGEASVFVLYRNVFDRYLSGASAYNLTDFLTNVLLTRTKDRILELSVDRGVRFLKGEAPEERQSLYQYLEGKGLAGTFEALERRMRDSGKSALLITYAEALFPAAESQFLSMDERAALAALHRWSLDDSLAAADNVVLLITESLSEINPALLTNPRVAAIEIPMPDRAARDAVIGHYAPKMSDAQRARLADHTAGLRAIQLASIVSGEGPGLDEAARLELLNELLKGSPLAAERAAKLAGITAGLAPEEIRRLIDPTRELAGEIDPDQEMLETVRRRKRELIEKECAGLIEFIESKHGLDAVGGNDYIKGELMDIAETIKSGDRARAPMGLLAVGPMGAGKTFVIKAFLKEANLSGVALKNFRSKWVGSTEANLDRVLATVKAMGPIALVIDEGDRSFGNSGEDSDGGTSSRVIARLKEFMSDTENRGQVLFILMTNRPDKLDTDIKRPGRLDRKIPFFYPETGAERGLIVEAILKRYKVEGAIVSSELVAQCDPLNGYSSADLEAVALLAIDLSRRAGQAFSLEYFAEAVGDFIPPQDLDMIRFMEMLAVSETSRRSLLPERLRKLTAEEIQKQLAQLRNAIRR
jgi:transitional endoplasmic reticulum ATPase